MFDKLGYIYRKHAQTSDPHVAKATACIVIRMCVVAFTLKGSIATTLTKALNEPFQYNFIAPLQGSRHMMQLRTSPTPETPQSHNNTLAHVFLGRVCSANGNLYKL